MVSFSCNKCQDTLKKPKLVQHFQRCHAPFTCLDCNKEMYDGEFQKHTTCISEAEKYEKTLYKGDKKKGKGQQQQQQKQNGQALQQQQKPAEPVVAAPPAVATPSVPSTSAATTNGSNTEPALTPNGASATDVKVAPSTSAQPTSEKKEKKRKRKSEVAKTAEVDAGNTSDAQIAKALVAETPAEKASPAAEPTPASKVDTPEVKSEEKKSRKRHKKDKAKAAASTNGDASMQVDAKPAGTAETAAAPAIAASMPKVDLKETLTSKIPEKGKSISLAEALEGLPADKIQEALAGLRVQKGKKDKFELSVGYA